MEEYRADWWNFFFQSFLKMIHFFHWIKETISFTAKLIYFGKLLGKFSEQAVRKAVISLLESWVCSIFDRLSGQSYPSFFFCRVDRLNYRVIQSSWLSVLHLKFSDDDLVSQYGNENLEILTIITKRIILILACYWWWTDTFCLHDIISNKFKTENGISKSSPSYSSSVTTICRSSSRS